jgi:hypothetical protein
LSADLRADLAVALRPPDLAALLDFYPDRPFYQWRSPQLTPLEMGDRPSGRLAAPTSAVALTPPPSPATVLRLCLAAGLGCVALWLLLRIAMHLNQLRMARRGSRPPTARLARKSDRPPTSTNVRPTEL